MTHYVLRSGDKVVAWAIRRGIAFDLHTNSERYDGEL